MKGWRHNHRAQGFVRDFSSLPQNIWASQKHVSRKRAFQNHSKVKLSTDSKFFFLLWPYYLTNKFPLCWRTLQSFFSLKLGKIKTTQAGVLGLQIRNSRTTKEGGKLNYKTQKKKNTRKRKLFQLNQNQNKHKWKHNGTPRKRQRNKSWQLRKRDHRVLTYNWHSWSPENKWSNRIREETTETKT